MVLTGKEDHPVPGDDCFAKDEGELARNTSIVLAEFAGLRGEIATRISVQFTLIFGNLTVLGVVLGIALSQPESTTVQGNTRVPPNRNILLLLPIVTSCIGLLVVDQFRNLDILGQYISRFIRPHLCIKSQRTVDGVEVFGWERWISRKHFAALLWFPVQFVLFLEFLGPPIAVLVYAYLFHLHHPEVRVSSLQYRLWWTGAVLTGVLFLYAVGYGAFSIGSSQGSRKARSNPGGQ